MKKRTYIVSLIINNYEWIHTETAYSKLTLQMKYLFKGHKPFNLFPKLKIKLYKWFNWKFYIGTDCTIDKLIPGSDQVTYHTPWSNFY